MVGITGCNGCHGALHFVGRALGSWDADEAATDHELPDCFKHDSLWSDWRGDLAVSMGEEYPGRAAFRFAPRAAF